MTQLDYIKKKIEDLYNENPVIHISVTMNSPKVRLENEEVSLKGVYPHVFRIEEKSTGTPKSHTFQYSDILTNQIIIAEL